jgi:hypothetical protein
MCTEAMKGNNITSQLNQHHISLKKNSSCTQTLPTAAADIKQHQNQQLLQQKTEVKAAT